RARRGDLLRHEVARAQRLIWTVARIAAHDTIAASMDEPTLRLVEAAVASQAPASAPHPIRDQLFPQLDRARTLEDAEKAIHGAGQELAWLGAALVADPQGEQLLREAVASVVPQMLTVQDELEQTLRAAVGSVAARKAIVAQETLRRFLAIW